MWRVICLANIQAIAKTLIVGRRSLFNGNLSDSGRTISLADSAVNVVLAKKAMRSAKLQAGCHIYCGIMAKLAINSIIRVNSYDSCAVVVSDIVR